MTETPTLSVVIPNWNGAHHLPLCLDALRAQTYPAVEVIVADNASTDGSQELLAEQHPEVHIVALPENRGFTGACNAGMEAAAGEFVALLNNDTEVDAEWAAAVVDAFNRYSDVGMVASKMLLFDRRDHLHTAGDFYRINGRPGNRGVWEKDEGQYDREEYVFSACGGSSAYRRSMLDEVGLLDDDFFFSCEDVDLGWRAQLAGYHCLYTPRAVVYHHLAATGGGVTASFHDGRNTLWVLFKNYPAALWRKHGWKILRAQVGLAWEALRAWRGAAARARLRGMVAGLWGLPKMLRKRRAIQQGRRVSMAYIESMLTPVAVNPVKNTQATANRPSAGSRSE
ncbi:MAG: glycosyltransferase family 2 protein [Chloroflexi bacterium]|nr:glycosyltransferase family 2 protein [Chloroflexota bacterium]